MAGEKELLSLQICSCGEKSVREAIEIFRNNDLPYKKAKRLVTGCDRSCCRRALTRLYDMVEFGKIDLEEIGALIKAMNNPFENMLDQLSSKQ
ncbi:MAG: hypothetical protein LBF86_08840 [Helicobacteraceae bacterium]|jgi:arsenate reductase-like glutaredoxin family protein|nr:hypothetical protein [Helicobacteraceae bacterium]